MQIALQNPAFGGGALGWLNCNAAAGAMLVDMETGGHWTPSAADVRECCLEENGHRDVTGGTRPSQIIDALKRCFNVKVDGQTMDYEEAWKLGQRSDTAVSMSVRYSVVSGTRFDGSPGFTGNHQIVLSGGMVYDPTYDGRRAGIPNGPQKWPKELLRQAAGKYANVGVGRAAVIIGKAPAIKPSSFSVRFAKGAVYAYDTKNHRIRVNIPRTTSAPCSAPFNVPWLNGRKRLVEVQKGHFTGVRFEPGATHVKLVERKAA